MAEIEEMAKATVELAKFGQKSVGLTEKMGKFLALVFKEPLEQVSGIIGDKLKFIRWERQIRMVDEVNKILKEKGITETRSIPPKFLIPFIENACLEEDDNLQDLWNKLIVNSLDVHFNSEIRYTYIEIIKSLTSLDALVLKIMYESLIENKFDLNKISDYSISKEQISKSMNKNIDEIVLSIYNLFRVQCLAPAILTGGVMLGSEPITIYKGINQVTMTSLGKAFVEACIK